MRLVPGMFVILAAAVLAGSAWAQETCSDSVYTFVEETSLTVMHTGALYNCCPTRFDYDVSLGDQGIVVREVEILEEPCYCLCCIDLEAVIEDVPPGEYTLEFCWYDYESWQWKVWTLPVVVPGPGAGSGDPHLARSSRSGCYGTTPVPEGDDDLQTWSMVKALYR